MRYRLWRNGKTIDLSLEKKLGEGGEARVFCVAAMGMAAKIYHHLDPKYAPKLKLMLDNPPADPTSGRGHVSIAWPNDLLLDSGGNVRGYVMPLVEGMQALVNFYVPKLRRQERPLFDYHYLVTAALNVATAVRALHDRNYVIGDVNESNILLSDRALATWVDTDSFQVFNTASGKIYRCLVGKPEFTPPELHGMNFAGVDRTREHDCFGLSVILFQLLMEGTHPFDGVYSRPGEPPSVDERIAAGHFPYGDGGMGPFRPKPIAPPFGMLDPALQRLFLQCFLEGHARPRARPDAAAWRGTLAQAAQNLRTCPVNDRHRHWGHVTCPWCERARLLRGLDPFPSVQAVKQGRHLLQRSIGTQTKSLTSGSPIPFSRARFLLRPKCLPRHPVRRCRFSRGRLLLRPRRLP
jgi:DNA-binding helix-hairpin-helix protein with protein kinase domain